jgi:hypothetical protein
MDPRAAVEIVVAVAALWGAGLATYEAIARRRQNRPRLRVTLRLSPMEDGERRFDRALVLRAENVGLLPIRIDAYGLMACPRFGLQLRKPTDGSSGVVFIGADRFTVLGAHGSQVLPLTLEPGNSIVLWFDPVQMNGIRIRLLQERRMSGRIQIHGILRDAISNEYVSEPFFAEVAKWHGPSQSAETESLRW